MLHGLTARGEVGAPEAQDRRGGGHRQEPRDPARTAHHLDGLFEILDRETELPLHRPDHRGGGEIGLEDAPADGLGEIRRHVLEGPVLSMADTRDANHRRPLGDPQRRGRIRRGRADPALEWHEPRLIAERQHVLHRADHAKLAVGRDGRGEGAAAHLTGEEPLVPEDVQRLAHGHPAHMELAAEGVLGGKALGPTPAALPDAGAEGVGDPHVARGGAALCHGCRGRRLAGPPRLSRHISAARAMSTPSSRPGAPPGRYPAFVTRWERQLTDATGAPSAVRTRMS